MRIDIEIRNVYGREAIYPVNEAARYFAELIGAKTLQPRHLAIAKRLGHEINEVRSEKLAAIMEELPA